MAYRLPVGARVPRTSQGQFANERYREGKWDEGGGEGRDIQTLMALCTLTEPRDAQCADAHEDSRVGAAAMVLPGAGGLAAGGEPDMLGEDTMPCGFEVSGEPALSPGGGLALAVAAVVDEGTEEAAVEAAVVWNGVGAAGLSYMPTSSE